MRDSILESSEIWEYSLARVSRIETRVTVNLLLSGTVIIIKLSETQA